MTSKPTSATARTIRIAHWVIPLGISILIGMVMPRGIRFKYDFDMGQIWRHGDFHAPFDVPLLKSEAAIALEKETIQQSLNPYFIMDTDVADEVIKQYHTDFGKEVTLAQSDISFTDVINHPKRYKDIGSRLIHSIYQKGILDQPTKQQFANKNSIVHLLVGNERHQRSLAVFFDIDAAYDFITDSLPYSGLVNPEFLLPILEQSIFPNVYYSDSLTQKIKSQELSKISISEGLIKSGELIIANNMVIDAETHQKLLSLKTHYEADFKGKYAELIVIIANCFFIGMLLFSFFVFVKTYEKSLSEQTSKIILLFIWPVIFSFLSIFVAKYQLLNPYFIPFAVVPLVLKNFMSIRLSFLTYLVVVLISGFILSTGIDFLIIQAIVGVIALTAAQEIRYWSKFFISIAWIFFGYSMTWLMIELIRNGNFGTVDVSVFPWLLLNGLLLLIAYPLIPLLARMFGILTPIRLSELSDFNHPLLKELSQKAPGSFQHSIQVSNLAEAAAKRIQADAMLVKVAALYHDIGKIKNPDYFIENQKGDNPHDILPAQQSAAIIIEHVTEGGRLAKKHKLPKEIIQFIWSHHGTTRVEYFYQNEIKLKGQDQVNEALFRYPGPKPITKEEVILMLADSMEASAHSLKEPTEKSINALIDKVLKFKQDTQQFTESQITYAELQTIIQSIRESLHHIYHIRLAYPD